MNNKEKAKRLKEKANLIGFQRSRYKSVKFDKSKHKHLLAEGAFISFWYGVRKVNFSNMYGRVISSPEKRGVQVYTESGFHAVLWKRIKRVFVRK